MPATDKVPRDGVTRGGGDVRAAVGRELAKHVGKKKQRKMKISDIPEIQQRRQSPVMGAFRNQSPIRSCDTESHEAPS